MSDTQRILEREVRRLEHVVERRRENATDERGRERLTRAERSLANAKTRAGHRPDRYRGSAHVL